ERTQHLNFHDHAPHLQGDFFRVAKLAGAWCPVSALPTNKHGDSAVGQNLDSLAAKHNRRKSTSPVRGHNDQIAMFVGRGLDDRLIGMIMLYIHNVAGHAFFQCHALHSIEAFLRKAFQLRPTGDTHVTRVTLSSMIWRAIFKEACRWMGSW